MRRVRAGLLAVLAWTAACTDKQYVVLYPPLRADAFRLEKLPEPGRPVDLEMVRKILEDHDRLAPESAEATLVRGDASRVLSTSVTEAGLIKVRVTPAEFDDLLAGVARLEVACRRDGVEHRRTFELREFLEKVELCSRDRRVMDRCDLLLGVGGWTTPAGAAGRRQPGPGARKATGR